MKTILFVVLTIFYMGVYSQNAVTDSSATCVAFWKKGETRRYIITRTKERFSGNERIRESEVSFEANLRVVDSTERGYTLEWKQRNYQSAGVDDETLNMLNVLMRDLKLIYKTDEFGAFSELINWKEVRDFWMDKLNRSFDRKDKQLMEIVGKFKSMLEKREHVEQAVIKELQLYHAAYGIAYSRRGDSAESLLPNISGGEAIPAYLFLRLDSMDTSRDVCQVSIAQSIDKRKGRDVVVDMMKKLVPKDIDMASYEKEFQELLMDDVKTFRYSLSTGWISNVRFARTVRVGPLRQVETYEIEDEEER